MRRYADCAAQDFARRFATGVNMVKNGKYQGRVIGLGTEGEGIINCGGTTAFVPFCLIGEDVSFTALKVKGNVADGRYTEISRLSPERAEPQCAVFGKCGGCALQHMNYPAQLSFKRDLVKNCLQKLGGITCGVGDTVPCDREYRYRNKLVLPIGADADGNVVCGFFAPRSHRIVPISDCPIQAEWVKDVAAAVKQFAIGRHVKAFDGKSGVLRHIVVREVGGRFIFALVCASDIDVDPLISLIERKFADFTFLLNVNPENTNVIFGKQWRICRGEGLLEAEEAGVKYTVGANTFVQVNDGVRKKLYAAVLDEAGGNSVAIDLYSGGGMLTAMLAKRCGKAYGIEIAEEASRCADELKERNGLDGSMINVCGAAEDNLGLIAEVSGGRGVIVCDPPRKGMERSVVKAIAQSGAGKVILISCNPATLARDLGLLTGSLIERGGALVKCAAPQSNYEIASVTPFDMFPQTKHVETLVVLRTARRWV